MTYVDRIRAALEAEQPSLDPCLLDLYALLALTRGEDVSLEDVHDAWSIWRARTDPRHHSIVPFKELTTEVQELDRPYADAIHKVAADLRAGVTR